MRQILAIGFSALAFLACQNIQSQKGKMLMTKSGYQYYFENDEPGPVLEVGQYALIHATTWLEDSVINDTRISPGEPVVVRIEGEDSPGASPVHDVLRKMSVGDHLKLIYPFDSMPSVPPQFEGYTELVYEITIVDAMLDEEAYQEYMDGQQQKEMEAIEQSQHRLTELRTMMAGFYEAYQRGEHTWQTTASGLQYIILEAGQSGVRAAQGQMVKAQYYGMFEADGQELDSSFSRGRSSDFAVGTGQVIKGWDEAFMLLEKGDRAVILVPADLAYGEQGYPGAIPPNAKLFFYVELLDVVQ